LVLDRNPQMAALELCLYSSYAPAAGLGQSTRCYTFSKQPPLGKSLFLFSLPVLTFPSLSPGVIAVVIFIIFCVVAIMSRFLYQHKQAHRSSQAKEKEYAENLDSSFKTDIDLQNTVCECKREYFI
uniref:Uncharacterized protein n=1 Tax=Gopherus agassizii TaxID=38772 RepID=A0A452HAQ6_9SAUR